MSSGPQPPKWVTNHAGQIFSIVGGGTPATGDPSFWNGSIPWISSADIDEEGRISPRRGITDAAVAASAANPVPAGTAVVVTRVGLGKVGLTRERLCFSQDCHGLLVPEGLIDPAFAAHQLRWAVRNFKSVSRGTTIAGVTRRQLADLEFRLPPREEQTRIAAAIDSYLSRLGEVESLLERVRRNLDRYRAAVLKAAVEGRLVPTEAELARAEGRDYEPADVLLKRILAERRRRWEEAELVTSTQEDTARRRRARRPQYKEAPSPDPSRLPLLPEGWRWATLPQLGELSRGKSQHRPRNDPRLLEGPYPFIQTGDVQRADGFIRSHTATYSQAGLAQSRLWPAGTLCITIAANIAETGILGFDACFPDSIVGFSCPAGPVQTRFIELFLRTERERLRRLAPATAQKNINLDTLSRVAVALPPADEQGRIVAEVDRLLSLGRDIEFTCSISEGKLARLRRAALKWAFEGRLVDQDPADEPASVLLERIRRETAAARVTSGQKEEGRRRPRGRLRNGKAKR